MPSSDQSSAAGSGNFNAAGIIDIVLPDFFRSLQQVEDIHSSQDEHQIMGNEAEKLKKDLIYIRESFNNLKGFEDTTNALLNALKELSFSNDLLTGGLNVSSRHKQLRVRAKLRAINKIVMELKLQIPLPYKLSSKESDAHRFTRGDSDTEFYDLEVVDELPVLHADKEFGNSLAFRDFRLVYDKLDNRTKLCLLCFALIPENEIVKKRFMTYWWVGEGFVSRKLEKAADGTLKEWLSVEEVADGIFKELAKKDCIEPVNEMHKFVVDSYKMNPFIRSAVIVLAKEAGFFDFHPKNWNPSADFKASYRACLVDGFSQQLAKSDSELDPKKLQTIFNVNEPYPDFFKSEWFSKFKNVKVLYLGRWQSSANHHIEVDGVEFLKGLKSMKLLRLLSLQGILGIIELPDSVCKLLNLRILDLRACQNLEALPNGIGSLENLTHLDLSECYSLDYMPMGIKFLSKLLVLKRFVIGNRLNENSCTLADLSGLKKLRKLSIYTNTEAFPNEDDEINLRKLENLEKLTIEWEDFPSNTDSDPQWEDFPSKTDSNRQQDKARLVKRLKTLDRVPAFKHSSDRGSPMQHCFEKLKKLDLKCYPSKYAPSWLLPRKLPKLEKLYIRRGKLQNLSSGQESNKWKVNILRLKFLSNLKMDWKELLSSFPDLIYLEKYKCPKLTFFPCNENGIVLTPRTDAGRSADILH